MTITNVILSKSHDRPLRNRHPWIFSGAVKKIEGDPQPGDVAVCRDVDGAFLAWGTVNPKARIVFRAFSFVKKEPLDGGLIRRRLLESINRRLPLIPSETNAYRLVHSEADGLPGLVVDRFADSLVVQITTAGMLRFVDEINQVLTDELSPEIIRLKTPRRSAREEGIPQVNSVLYSKTKEADLKDEISFRENGIDFLADLAGGQKTGFYLDQRDNRLLARRLSAGKRVLDAYSYSGGFGLSASLGGATQVTCIDSSKSACEVAAKNFAAGGISPELYNIVCCDVPAYLRDEKVDPFDLIVLDPPPFSPGRSSAEAASRAYKDINLQAFKKLTPGGLLLTFSCSSSIGSSLLGKIVFGAALDAGVEARILARLSQPFDHPVSVYHPEGEYLFGLLIQVGG